MPAPGRLPGRGRFSQVYRYGTTTSHPYLVMKFMPNGTTQSRFGFGVGKALGGAVTRNRLRRRLREAVRQCRVAGGWDAVLLARPPVQELDFSGMSEAVADLLGRAGLLVEE